MGLRVGDNDGCPVLSLGAYVTPSCVGLRLGLVVPKLGSCEGLTVASEGLKVGDVVVALGAYVSPGSVGARDGALLGASVVAVGSSVGANVSPK